MTDHHHHLLGRVTIEPGKMGGRPCIRGLGIRVMDILDMLAGGARRDEILGSFPCLEDEDITAALLYAVRLTDQKPVFDAAWPKIEAALHSGERRVVVS